MKVQMSGELKEQSSNRYIPLNTLHPILKDLYSSSSQSFEFDISTDISRNEPENDEPVELEEELQQVDYIKGSHFPRRYNKRTRKNLNVTANRIVEEVIRLAVDKLNSDPNSEVDEFFDAEENIGLVPPNNQIQVNFDPQPTVESVSNSSQTDLIVDPNEVLEIVDANDASSPGANEEASYGNEQGGTGDMTRNEKYCRVTTQCDRCEVYMLNCFKYQCKCENLSIYSATLEKKVEEYVALLNNYNTRLMTSRLLIKQSNGKQNELMLRCDELQEKIRLHQALKEIEYRKKKESKKKKDYYVNKFSKDFFDLKGRPPLEESELEFLKEIVEDERLKDTFDKYKLVDGIGWEKLSLEKLVSALADLEYLEKTKVKEPRVGSSTTFDSLLTDERTDESVESYEFANNEASKIYEDLLKEVISKAEMNKVFDKYKSIESINWSSLSEERLRMTLKDLSDLEAIEKLHPFTGSDSQLELSDEEFHEIEESIISKGESFDMKTSEHLSEGKHDQLEKLVTDETEVLQTKQSDIELSLEIKERQPDSQYKKVIVEDETRSDTDVFIESASYEKDQISTDETRETAVKDYEIIDKRKSDEISSEEQPIQHYQETDGKDGEMYYADKFEKVSPQSDVVITEGMGTTDGFEDDRVIKMEEQKDKEKLRGADKCKEQEIDKESSFDSLKEGIMKTGESKKPEPLISKESGRAVGEEFIDRKSASDSKSILDNYGEEFGDNGVEISESYQGGKSTAMKLNEKTRDNELEESENKKLDNIIYPIAERDEEKKKTVDDNGGMLDDDLGAGVLDRKLDEIKSEEMGGEHDFSSSARQSTEKGKRLSKTGLAMQDGSVEGDTSGKYVGKEIDVLKSQEQAKPEFDNLQYSDSGKIISKDKLPIHDGVDGREEDGVAKKLDEMGTEDHRRKEPTSTEPKIEKAARDSTDRIDKELVLPEKTDVTPKKFDGETDETISDQYEREETVDLATSKSKQVEGEENYFPPQKTHIGSPDTSVEKESLERDEGVMPDMDVKKDTTPRRTDEKIFKTASDLYKKEEPDNLTALEPKQIPKEKDMLIEKSRIEKSESPDKSVARDISKTGSIKSMEIKSKTDHESGGKGIERNMEDGLLNTRPETEFEHDKKQKVDIQREVVDRSLKDFKPDKLLDDEYSKEAKPDEEQKIDGKTMKDKIINDPLEKKLSIDRKLGKEPEGRGAEKSTVKDKKSDDSMKEKPSIDRKLGKEPEVTTPEGRRVEKSTMEDKRADDSLNKKPSIDRKLAKEPEGKGVEKSTVEDKRADAPLKEKPSIDRKLGKEPEVTTPEKRGVEKSSVEDRKADDSLNKKPSIDRKLVKEPEVTTPEGRGVEKSTVKDGKVDDSLKEKPSIERKLGKELEVTTPEGRGVEKSTVKDGKVDDSLEEKVSHLKGEGVEKPMKDEKDADSLAEKKPIQTKTEEEPKLTTQKGKEVQKTKGDKTVDDSSETSTTAKAREKGIEKPVKDGEQELTDKRKSIESIPGKEQKVTKDKEKIADESMRDEHPDESLLKRKSIVGVQLVEEQNVTTQRDKGVERAEKDKKADNLVEKKSSIGAEDAGVEQYVTQKKQMKSTGDDEEPFNQKVMDTTMQDNLADNRGEIKKMEKDLEKESLPNQMGKTDSSSQRNNLGDLQPVEILKKGKDKPQDENNVLDESVPQIIGPYKQAQQDVQNKLNEKTPKVEKLPREGAENDSMKEEKRAKEHVEKQADYIEAKQKENNDHISNISEIFPEEKQNYPEKDKMSELRQDNSKVELAKQEESVAQAPRQGAKREDSKEESNGKRDEIEQNNKTYTLREKTPTTDEGDSEIMSAKNQQRGLEKDTAPSSQENQALDEPQEASDSIRNPIGEKKKGGKTESISAHTKTDIVQDKSDLWSQGMKISEKVEPPIMEKVLDTRKEKMEKSSVGQKVLEGSKEGQKLENYDSIMEYGAREFADEAEMGEKSKVSKDEFGETKMYPENLQEEASSNRKKKSEQQSLKAGKVEKDESPTNVHKTPEHGKQITTVDADILSEEKDSALKRTLLDPKNKDYVIPLTKNIQDEHLSFERKINFPGQTRESGKSKRPQDGLEPETSISSRREEEKAGELDQKKIIGREESLSGAQKRRDQHQPLSSAEDYKTKADATDNQSIQDTFIPSKNSQSVMNHKYDQESQPQEKSRITERIKSIESQLFPTTSKAAKFPTKSAETLEHDQSDNRLKDKLPGIGIKDGKLSKKDSKEYDQLGVKQSKDNLGSRRSADEIRNDRTGDKQQDRIRLQKQEDKKSELSKEKQKLIEAGKPVKTVNSSDHRRSSSHSDQLLGGKTQEGGVAQKEKGNKDMKQKGKLDGGVMDELISTSSSRVTNKKLHVDKPTRKADAYPTRKEQGNADKPTGKSDTYSVKNEKGKNQVGPSVENPLRKSALQSFGKGDQYISRNPQNNEEPSQGKMIRGDGKSKEKGTPDYSKGEANSGHEREEVGAMRQPKNSSQVNKDGKPDLKMRRSASQKVDPKEIAPSKDRNGKVKKGTGPADSQDMKHSKSLPPQYSSVSETQNIENAEKWKIKPTLLEKMKKYGIDVFTWDELDKLHNEVLVAMRAHHGLRDPEIDETDIQSELQQLSPEDLGNLHSELSDFAENKKLRKKPFQSMSRSKILTQLAGSRAQSMYERSDLVALKRKPAEISPDITQKMMKPETVKIGSTLASDITPRMMKPETVKVGNSLASDITPRIRMMKLDTVKMNGTSPTSSARKMKPETVEIGSTLESEITPRMTKPETVKIGSSLASDITPRMMKLDTVKMNGVPPTSSAIQRRLGVPFVRDQNISTSRAENINEPKTNSSKIEIPESLRRRNDDFMQGRRPSKVPDRRASQKRGNILEKLQQYMNDQPFVEKPQLMKKPSHDCHCGTPQDKNIVKKCFCSH